MKYRLVEKVKTNRHGAETKSYYIDYSPFGPPHWQKVKRSESLSFIVSESFYLDLINPPTVTTEVLATNEVK